MKRILIILMLCPVLAFSQTTGKLLSLDKYMVPVNEKGACVGNFMVQGNNKVELVKDPSGLFVINGTKLCLKANKSITANSPMIFDITVKYKNEEKEFSIVKDQFIHNKVVAHRGAWKHYDVHQNSMGALKHAVELGCEASEFDVWLSKDRRVVLNHDHEIDGLIIEETELAEMRKIILESGEVMATLEQYLEYIKTQNKTRLVLELKTNKQNKRGFDLADSAVNIVHRMKAQAWVDYISFDYDVLVRVHSLDSGAHLAYLGADRPMDLQKVEGMSGIDYHFSQFNRIERMYDRARALGFTINIWTVNDEKVMRELLDMNVDFITTDEPELLLKIISETKKSK